MSLIVGNAATLDPEIEMVPPDTSTLTVCEVGRTSLTVIVLLPKLTGVTVYVSELAAPGAGVLAGETVATVVLLLDAVNVPM